MFKLKSDGQIACKYTEYDMEDAAFLERKLVP